ncbi:hypothetical protein CAOG_009693 [Capsaspora owczarzaki ATCC 30864]|uniref:Phosphatidate phosphatase APP1 catalytic domain-containing protein n=1 Tax=Capsaspora owczarzaki (strain ATCC 30864) TaxID=595528 RepID=A0A0D2UCE3_CAPO3|nr:hypothetical protein CAOG_009693 [Capsaspora owczarzaki ATCC 30864]
MSDGPGPGASTTAHHQQHPHSHHHRRPKKVARFLLRSLTRCCYTVAWLLGVVAVLVGVLLALDLYATHFSEQAVQTDEHVEFFITHSSCNLEDTLSNECFVTAHGVVFEPELDSSVRRQVASTILHLVGLQQLDDAARRNYDRRVWLFMRDFERGKNVSVALTPCSEPHHRVAEGTNVDDHSFLHRALHWTLHSRDVAVHEEGDEAGKPRTCDEHCLLLRELHKQVVVGTMLTAANGHFKLSIPVPKSLVKHYLRDSPSPVLWVCFRTVLPEADRRVFTGRAQLSIVGSGRPLHVISDIDDTIKVTHVRFLRRMAAHTFLHEYEAVQGMARLFRRLAVAHHAVFHYVSGSPWQLHEDLVAMMTRAGFPLGSMHLKLVLEH